MFRKTNSTSGVHIFHTNARLSKMYGVQTSDARGMRFWMFFRFQRFGVSAIWTNSRHFASPCDWPRRNQHANVTLCDFQMCFFGSNKIATESGPSYIFHHISTFHIIPLDPDSAAFWVAFNFTLLSWTFRWFHRWFRCWQFSLPAINPLAMRAPQSSPRMIYRRRQGRSMESLSSGNVRWR